MPDLARRSTTAVLYGAAILLAVAAPPLVFWLLLVGVGALGLAELLGLRRAGRSALAAGTLFFVGLASLGALRELGSLGARFERAPDLPVWLFLAVLPTWAADVAAYLVGSTLGRRRLAPSISPGKTWEGTLAGFGACALVALAAGAAFGLPRLAVAVAAIGLGPIGLAGDLLESYMKRRAGVKDSGTILPGHGGVLDRLDSLVAAAIFILVLVRSVFATQLGAEGGF